MNLEKMATNNGEFTQEGIHYILTQQAYIDTYGNGITVYSATAIRADSTPDENGDVKLYNIKWEITNHETEDESEACNWDEAFIVEDSGASYNLTNGTVN